MRRYILRRLAHTVIVLLGVSIITFAIVHLIPGDPIRIALGTRFDQASYDALYARAGFDQPLIVQYFQWLTGALQGDLGVSFRSGQPVTPTILGRLPATMTLAFAALAVALVIALPVGIISAVRRGSVIDYGSTVFSQIGISMPDFWMGIMLILVFSATLGWLPSQGYVPLTEDPVQWFRHLIMPAITIGVVSGSVLTRFVRSSMLEVLDADYTRTARSKGLSQRVVINRHALKNALIPFVTVTGLQLAVLLGGVVIVEIVFSWPGLGQLALIAVQRRDYSVLQGTVLLLAFITLMINLIVDLLYEGGIARMRYSVSDTAEYGDYYTGSYIIDDDTRQRMRTVLERVQNGTFARDWILENQTNRPGFNAERRRQSTHEIEQVGARLRGMMSWLPQPEDH